MRLRLSLIIMLMVLAGTGAGGQERGADTDVVLVGSGKRTVPEAGPITQLDEEAYSQDLMEIVARAAGLKYRFVIIDSWADMIAALQSGRIDVMPTVARLPERASTMLFTVPHVQGGLVLIVRSGTRIPTSVDEIAGKRLFIEANTVQYSYAAKHGWTRDAIIARTVGTGAELSAVAEGRADGTILNEFSAIAMIHRLNLQDRLTIAMTLPDSIVDFCMAVRTGNDRLLARLNEGLFLAQQRGDLKRNYEKWFIGVEAPRPVSETARRWLMTAGAAVIALALAGWGWFRYSLIKARRRTEKIARMVEDRTAELASANAQLRFSEEKFSKAFMASPDSICIVQQADNSFIDVNDAFVETFGYDRSEVLGRTSRELNLWTSFKERDRLIGVLKAEGRVKNAPYFFKRKDGEIRTGLVSMEAIKIGDSDCIAAIIRDITEAERANAALRESEARFRTLVESAPEAIIVFDADSREVTEANENALRLLEAARSEIVGADLERLSPALQEDGRASDKAMRELVARTLAGETPAAEWTVVGLKGKRTAVELRLVRLPSVERHLVRGLLTDVTERRRLEEQLRQAQRMESIGQLAGGVAHDFNNILTVIQCNTSLLLADKGFPEAYRESIGQIEQSSTFAAGLTRQLLVFSRKQVIQRTRVNIAAAIQQTTRLLSRVIGENIALEVQVPSSLPPIFADNGMVEQVLLNLAVNARDAMPKGGRLSIRAGLVERDADYVRRVPQAKVGRYICISMGDTGTGIAPEVLPRIFDPFFTTKDLGKGTGLGLSTVYGIVQQHQGWIEIDSVVGSGTEFRVHFICMEEEAEAAEVPAPEGSTRGRAGTILVVEDEAFVRMTSCNILRREGYRVLDAASAQAALTVWEQARDEIDLVFTDIVMPGGMTGRELVDQLRRERPGLKALFTSGYSSDLLGHDFTRTAFSYFLQKPFGVTELKRAIAETLHTA